MEASISVYVVTLIQFEPSKREEGGVLFSVNTTLIFLINLLMKVFW